MTISNQRDYLTTILRSTLVSDMSFQIRASRGPRDAKPGIGKSGNDDPHTLGEWSGIITIRQNSSELEMTYI